MHDSSRAKRGVMTGLTCLFVAVPMILWALYAAIYDPTPASFQGREWMRSVGLFIPAMILIVAGVWLIRANRTRV